MAKEISWHVESLRSRSSSVPLLTFFLGKQTPANTPSPCLHYDPPLHYPLYPFPLGSFLRSGFELDAIEMQTVLVISIPFK